ncbi:MAG TPA: GTPase HflX [Alphaproteobacteria bacterium]|nr:GTPase HflX [Alphaproteobacteria bacterium]
MSRTRKKRPPSDAAGATRAAVVVPLLSRGRRGPESRLEEAVGLARSIGLEVVLSEAVPLRGPRPATLIGKGKLEALGKALAERAVAVAVIDGPLSPVQQRNLEKAWSCKVIDRTALILEIFGERARTKEGTLQVELAALDYQLSRLVRSWTHLERQRGGFGFLGGPGETQIETDRRLIRERIARIREELEQVKRTRGLHREARRRVPFPVVALVGYTNAGKSTLFNRLTGAAVVVRAQLFATLDPTLRALALPSGQRIILSDTVGFVSELPTQLIAAFRATLEEVVSADLIVHVRDISHPDAEAQRTDVEQVLRELGLGDRVEEGLLEALNKIDRLDGEVRLRTLGRSSRSPDLVPLSALTGEGIERLLRRIDERLGSGRRAQAFWLDLASGAPLAWLYQHGEVLERIDEGGRVWVRVLIAPKERGRFLSRFAGRARAAEVSPRVRRQRA